MARPSGSKSYKERGGGEEFAEKAVNIASPGTGTPGEALGSHEQSFTSQGSRMK